MAEELSSLDGYLSGLAAEARNATHPVHVEIGDVWIDVSVHETHTAGAEVSEHPVEFGAVVADHIRPLPRTITIEGIVTNHPMELPRSHAGAARVSGETLPIVAYPRAGAPRVPPSSVQIEGEPSIGWLGALPGSGQAVSILGAIGIPVGNKLKLAAELHHTDPRATETYAAAVVHFNQPFDRCDAVHKALLEIVETSQLVRIVTGLDIYDSVALTDLTIERSGELGRHVLRFTAIGRVLRIVESDVVKLPKPVDARAKASKSQGKQAAPAVPPTAAPASGADPSSVVRKVLHQFFDPFGDF